MKKIFATALFAALGLSGFALLPLAAQAPVPPPATAQASASNFASQITGTVTADGVPVPGATVTVTDTVSGQKYVTSTDDSGRFLARVGHSGEFDISADMAAFAPVQATVNVPATGGAVAPLSLSLILASRAPAAPAPAPASTAATAAGNAPAKPAAAASNAPPSIVAANSGGRGGRGGRGNGGGNGFQQLDLSQTGDINNLGDNSDTSSSSGIAGMNDSAATDSTVVNGQASQDDTPLNANSMQSYMRQNGGGPGGPGGPGRGPGGPGGGRGGPGGFGGGRNFNFQQMANRFNQPHGNFSYQLSDTDLDGLPDSLTGSSDTQKPPNAVNQRLSGTFTTPLKIPHIYDSHGKTNVSLSYTFQHNASPVNETALVPTLAERGGNFNGVATVTNPTTGAEFNNDTILPCTAGEAAGSCISPAAQALLNYFPLPTPGAVGAYNYTNTVNPLTTTNNLSMRVNHTFGAAPQSFGRGSRGESLSYSLNYTGTNSDNPGLFFPYEEGFTKTLGLNTGLNYTKPLHGWLDIASINFNRSRTQTTNLYEGNTDVAANAGINGVSTSPSTWGLPSLDFTASGINGLTDTNPNFLRQQTWSFSDSLIRRMGKHNFRLGGDFRKLQSNPEQDASPNGTFSFDGQYTGYDFADFLVGDPQQASERFGGGAFYFRQTEPDLFFNDNWQVSGNFTLQYGARWEYISPYSELDDRITNMLVGPDFSTLTPVVAGLGGESNTIIQPNYHHFRPTLGFAYKTFDNFLLMGGGGMAYNTGAYANIASALAFQSPFITSATNVGGATTPLSLANAFGGAPEASDYYAVNPKYNVGYAFLWNLDLQRQIHNTWVVNIDYSASKGTDLDQLRAPNRTADGLLYPDLQPFLYDTTGGNSIYNSGNLVISRRLSKGFSFRIRYTYASAFDDASQIGGGGGATGIIAQNDLDLDGERGRTLGIPINALNGSYEWQLPYGLNHKWGDSSGFMSSAFGDWQVSGSFTINSGTFYTPTVSNEASNAIGLEALGVNVPLRPNLTGQSIVSSSPTEQDYFNTAAFAAPALGSYGDAGRDSIEGPGETVLNMYLSKTFRMGEYRNLEIRFQGTNALNHPYWTGLNTNLSSPLFGSISGFGTPRQITFVARYRF